MTATSAAINSTFELQRQIAVRRPTGQPRAALVAAALAAAADLAGGWHAGPRLSTECTFRSAMPEHSQFF